MLFSNQLIEKKIINTFNKYVINILRDSQVIVFSVVCCIFGLMIASVELMPTDVSLSSTEITPTKVTEVAKRTGKNSTPRPLISDEALEKALSDKRYLQRQLKCALGEAACDPVGKRLKSELIFVSLL